MLRIVIAVVLLAHGIGHVMGPLQVLRVATVNPAWRGDSWLLTGPVGTPATNVLGLVLWTVALVGFALLAGAVVGWLPEAWFAPLGVGCSIVSLAALLVFPIAFPTLSTIAAAAVDVAVLVAVLWYHWVPSDAGA
jgi:hypothetical protein